MKVLVVDYSYKILELLKDGNQNSLTPIADHIKITRQRTHYHLQTLITLGLATSTTQKEHKDGRKKMIWLITEKGLRFLELFA
jgi:predicted ArsR family transcriptional regulator